MELGGGPSEGGRGRSRVAGLRFWLLPALLSAGLAAWKLTGAALWADELATWGAVRLSWSQLKQLCGNVDFVLWPYYAAMKVYTGVAGTGTAALRLPSALAVIGAVIVVAVCGRRLGGERVGLFAGLFFAVIPSSARYAQEARPYALAMFFAALSVLCVIRLIDKPGPSRAIAYGACLAATGLFHPLGGVLAVAGHAVAVLWCRLRSREVSWGFVGLWALAAAVGSIPAVLLDLRGLKQTAQVSWITDAGLGSLQSSPQAVFDSAAVGGIILALALLGAGRGPVTTTLVGAAFVPPVLLFLVGTELPIWVGRYVMIALAPLAVLAAAGALKAGRAQAVAALLLTALLSVPVQLQIREPDGHGEDSAKIATVIGPRYQAGDVAVFPDSHPSIPWAPRDIYERYLPAPRPPDVLAVSEQRTDGRLLARECPNASCLGDPPRIWVIRVDNSSDPFKDMSTGKRDRLAAHYKTVQSWKYPLLTIYLLGRR